MFGILEAKPTSQDRSPTDDSSPSQKPPVKPSRRRDKPQLSCSICRRKKLKCDRVKPCSNCTKRGLPESCDFTKQDSHARPTNVQDRVRQLEDTVRSLLKVQNKLVHNKSTTRKSPSADSPQAWIQSDSFTPSALSPLSQTSSQVPEASFGKLTKSSDRENFVGSDHWESILEDITELKMDLELNNTTERVEYRPRILFGMNHVSRSEILSSIPPRSVCDMLVSRWSKTIDIASLMVHIPKFLREYNEFFQNPDETPQMWFGLLFSVLGLATYLFEVSGEELPGMPETFASAHQMTSHFLDRTAQCLVEVNYLRPSQYTLETFCFYYALEKFHARMSDFASYTVLGTIIRVAMRLGYHRDASHYPSISTFEGERRRRLWIMIFQLDLTTSAQVGLPRMIREGDTDTAEPKNLLDSDFDEGITELPHPRPDTDATSVAYVIFKVRLLRQLGSIMDQLNSMTPPSYDEVLRLDSKLNETHTTLPPYLTMRPLSLSITDSVDLILRRFALEVCFQKSRCVLHRKYLIPGKLDLSFKYSRATCINAAMKLLQVQITFCEESQAGRQFSGEKWRNAAGLLHQDYVLAAMVLCLDLTWGMRNVQGQSHSLEDGMEVSWPREQRIKSLKSSYDIWRKSSTKSTLAAKAAEALRVMLSNLQSGPNAKEALPEPPIPNLDITSDFDLTPPTEVLEGDYPRHSEDFSTQYFTDFLSTSLTVTDFPMDAANTDLDTNFDWGLWDSQFQAPLVSQDYGLSEF